MYSTLPKVCHIKREKQNKVFNGMAIKDNVDDRNIKVMTMMTNEIFWKLFEIETIFSKPCMKSYFWMVFH